MSEERKKKISERLIGTIYIHKNSILKRIKKEELNLYLSLGWLKGMK